MDEDRKDVGRAEGSNGLGKLGETVLPVAGVIALLVIVLVSLGWIVREYPTAVATGLTAVAIGAGVLLALAFLTLAGWFVKMLYHYWQEALRDKAETWLADVITAPEGEQVYKRDGKEVEAWHNDPRWRHDGVYTEPSKAEMVTYMAKHLPKEVKEFVYGAADASQIEVERPVPALLEEVLRFDRWLLIGGSGSGKTTLLQHVVAAQTGETLVLDAHDDGLTWSEEVSVVGGNLDWPAIEGELYTLMDILASRYKERFELGKQPDEFTPLFFIIDEFNEVIENCEVAKKAFRKFLTGLRKVNMRMVVLAQTDRAEPLGLKGRKDLTASLEGIVRLTGNKHTAFLATIETSEGKYEAIPPGPYAPQLGAQREATYQTGQSKAPLPEADQYILDLWDGGERTKSRISKHVYGSKGGWQNERVTEVLKEHRGVNI